jgi:hypothetical protein
MTWRRDSWRKIIRGMHARRRERKTIGRKEMEESVHAEEKST